MYPAQQTLYYLDKAQKDKKYYAKLNYWVAYWILLSACGLLYYVLYFFPFAYETKVILTLALSHPGIEAPQLFITFVVQNPRVKIQIIKAKKKLKETLENKILPKMKQFKLFK